MVIEEDKTIVVKFENNVMQRIEDDTEHWYREGYLHRDNAPAIVGEDVEEWYRHGYRHRMDGPARIFKGEEFFFVMGLPMDKEQFEDITNEGKVHNEVHLNLNSIFRCGLILSVSAVEKRGIMHNSFGPALIHPDGLEQYYLGGKLHNRNGPAHIEYGKDGSIQRALYYLNGVHYTLQGFDRIVKGG